MLLFVTLLTQRIKAETRLGAVLMLGLLWPQAAIASSLDDAVHIAEPAALAAAKAQPGVSQASSVADRLLTPQKNQAPEAPLAASLPVAESSTTLAQAAPGEDSGDETTDDETSEEDGTVRDEELGILRLRPQTNTYDRELGIIRIRPNDEVPLEPEPEPTAQKTVFLTARANAFGGSNLFRTPDPIEDRIYQTGVGLYVFPKLSSRTNLVLSAEANLARYDKFSSVDYNELQFQAGVRQRLSERSYGQLTWRYQNLYDVGGDSFFTANYAELLLSRRDILNNRVWLDTYYQARWSDSNPEEFSRFGHIVTGTLNYGWSPQGRVSLLYQLFIDDYTQTSRHDTYHQVLAQVSHDFSDSTRLSFFTGARFGRSSLETVDFEDIIYGGSLNVSIPLF